MNLINWCIVLVVSGYYFVSLLLSRFDHNSHLVQCDVGQGDAILIWKESTQILIDVGGADGRIDECLSHYLPFWDRRIELLVITHFDLDHVGGLEYVVTKYNIKTLITGGSSQYYMSKMLLEPKFERLRPTGTVNDTVISYVARGKRYNLDNFAIDVLWPAVNENNIHSNHKFSLPNEHLSSDSITQHLINEDAKKDDKNSESVVLSLKFDGVSVLLTGDIPAEVEEKLFPDDLVAARHDILKVAHHGSRFSSSLDFLQNVEPRIALIGVGKNSYGHPHSEVLERIKTFKTHLCRTDNDGNIEITVDDGSLFLTSSESCGS